MSSLRAWLSTGLLSGFHTICPHILLCNRSAIISRSTGSSRNTDVGFVYLGMEGVYVTKETRVRCEEVRVQRYHLMAGLPLTSSQLVLAFVLREGRGKEEGGTKEGGGEG